MKSKNRYIFFLSVLILYSLPHSIVGQGTIETVVIGHITDSQTKEPLPFANIVFKNSNVGTISNGDGSFKLINYNNSNIIHVTSVGYESKEIEVMAGKTQTIQVMLKIKVTELGEVVVRKGKFQYKNKNNPAVEIIENVIKNKDLNRSENLNYLAYNKYDKTQFALSNLSEKFMNRKALKKFSFVFENIDSTESNGIKILPVYMKEKISENYFKNNPTKNKEIIIADKMVNFDGYINNQGMAAYMDYLYQHIDIYDNTITFVTNIFLSPIASSAPMFYRYFIQDTLNVNGVECIKLFFSPKNKEDMLFNGFLYIVKDSSYAISRVEMSVNKRINQNWVKDVSILQEFARVQNQSWLLTTDEISIDFGVSVKSLGVFGKRTVLYDNYKLNEPIPATVFEGPDVERVEDASRRNSEFWDSNRPVELTRTERGIYTITDSIKKIPTFKRVMDISSLLIAGFKSIGKVEIGPVNTFYSFNPIEGFRPRFGGRTTPEFSEKISFDTYLAYGFTDKKFKYYLGTTYSLTSKDINHFPVKSVKISLQNETSIPGQELQFIQEDNLLLSIKRGVNDKMFYDKTFKIEHLNEFENHFSYTLGYRYRKLFPGGSLDFNAGRTDTLSTDNQYLNISETYINLRYAPQEKFYQGKLYRTPMTNKFPIVNFNYSIGLTAMGNDYDYHNLKLNIYKRFYPGILGYTDVIWETGKIFGSVPFPLLFMHRANQTYAYQLAAYNLMNFLEFVSDQYTSINIDHHFNGFLFNKLPLTNKLQIREVVSGKILFGSLSDHNNPDSNPDLFKFQTDDFGNPSTFSLSQGPYIEVSAGVENIFKFFRVDLVKRLTYLDHPNVADWGVRVRFRFDF
jgi:hypothetical protein